MSQTTNQMSALTDEKRELLELLMQEQETRPTASPASFAQQRLWLVDQARSGSPFYNLTTAVELTGELDLAAFEEGLNQIISRHDSLRTTFDVLDGELYQLVSPHLLLRLPVYDLIHLSSGARRSTAFEMMNEEASRPFDLARGPLLRARVYRLDRSDFIFFVTMHHIISDAWSMGIMVRELAAAYQARISGKAVPFEELAIQYADFAEWQREYLEGDEMRRQLEYWKEQLKEYQVLDLPLDRPRLSPRGYAGSVEKLSVSKSLSERLETLGRREGATLFMVLLAAFKVLLMRYSGQTDIVVGTPIANRNHTELEGLIGFFVNMLAIRTDLSSNPSFVTLLRKIRHKALAAYEHQDLPCERWLWELRPDRKAGAENMFQAVFAFDNTPAPGGQLPGLAMKAIELKSNSAKFDLSLIMKEAGGKLEGLFEYSTELFDQSTIERLSMHYSMLLESVVRDPQTSILDLAMQTPEENRILQELNDTAVCYERDSSISEIFQQQCDRDPDAVAASYRGVALSYGELRRRANEIANYLKAEGVRAEEAVAIFIESPLDSLIAILGVVKSGAAYLPLDSACPKERIRVMLEEAEARFVLTESGLLGRLPAGIGTRILIDEESKQLRSAGCDDPDVSISADNLAYVMYTSGSTGRPKGVAVTHRGVLRLVRNSSYAELSKGTVILQTAPVSFDASTFEIWGSLLNGGRLVMTGGGSDCIDVVEHEIATEGVNTIWLTAGLFDEVVRGRKTSLKGISQLLAGGDVLNADTVRQVIEDGIEVINGYGPTESTTFAVCNRMRSPAEVGDRVAIGKPISNTRVYLLDKRLRVVPIGVTGEVFIARDGLARGYLNRADLTAASFIPDPQTQEAGARMYRTGDLARYKPDGRIEFLGRQDKQVKVRGYRIELDEIEAALAAHESVKQCAVVVKGGGAGEKRLIAFVVGRANGQATETDLKTYLGERLPAYMVPAVIKHLDELPLNENGKLDRSRLEESEVGIARPGENGDWKQPRTEVEALVADVWREVLGIEDIGVEDDFFEIGGHSLLGMKLANRLSEVFSVIVKLRNLFEIATVRGLSRWIEVQRLGEVRQGEKRIRRRGAAEAKLSYAQGRLWLLDQMDASAAAYTIRLRIRVRGRLDHGAMGRAIAELSRRHESLRTRVQQKENGPVQVVYQELRLGLCMIDLSELTRDERDREAERLHDDAGREAFDLTRDAPLRIRVLKKEERDAELLLVMHHIAADGWSMGVMVREIAELYEAYRAGKESPLPELEIQYADYAEWQREFLNGEEGARQIEFWRSTLRGAPTRLELAADGPRRAMQSYRGADESFSLGEKLSERLKELSRREGVTPFMALLAAFYTLLHRQTGQEDIVIGIGVANRTFLQTESLIGCLFNLLPLRADLSGNPSFRSLLARMRELALNALSHQDVPFEKLLEVLQPERDPRYSPLFQVLFEFRNRPSSLLRLSDLSLTVEEPPVVTSKFDLTLFMEQRENEFVGSFEYKTDLFEAATIRMLIRQFLRLLEEVVCEPGTDIMSLRLAGTEETRRAVFDFNEELNQS